MMLKENFDRYWVYTCTCTVYEQQLHLFPRVRECDERRGKGVQYLIKTNPQRERDNRSDKA